MSARRPGRVGGVGERQGAPRGGRGDGGLTTLEWLLVVAAVAGLAALGVVVVQSVVGGTAESVVSHSARQEAADLASTELENAWRAHRPSLLSGPRDGLHVGTRCQWHLDGYFRVGGRRSLCLNGRTT